MEICSELPLTVFLNQGIDWDHVGGIWQKALSLPPTRETNIVDALASMLRGAS